MSLCFLLSFNDGHCGRNKLDAALAFVFSCMQPAVSLEVIVAIEVVFAAKLAAKPVLAAFTMMPVSRLAAIPVSSKSGLDLRLLMALEMLHSPKALFASRVITLTNGLANNLSLGDQNSSLALTRP